jgi:hypothetical protein
MKSEGSELDLGIKDKDHSGPCCPSPEKPEMKVRYPDLCFRGKHAELFREKYGNCAPGDEYEMTVKLKVKSSSAGESDYDNRIEFEVLSIVGDVVEEEGEEEEEEKPKSTSRKLGQRKGY